MNKSHVVFVESYVIKVIPKIIAQKTGNVQEFRERLSLPKKSIGTSIVVLEI